MKYTQPSLMNVDEFAPHVDNIDPGTLTPEQWGARSDVYHHSGDNERWQKNRVGDPAVHVGSKEQAEQRGGNFMHRLRVPKERLTSKVLDDVGANSLHMAAAEVMGGRVDESITESASGESKSTTYDLHDGSKVRTEPAMMEDVDAFTDRGWAFPYVNSGEDVRQPRTGPGSLGTTYGTSVVSPQKTARTWAQDVDTSLASVAHLQDTDPSFAREVGPSSGILQQRQFLGTRGVPSETQEHYNRDQSMEPFKNHQKMPHLPQPGSDDVRTRAGRQREGQSSYEVSRTDNRYWDKTSKGK